MPETPRSNAGGSTRTAASLPRPSPDVTVYRRTAQKVLDEGYFEVADTQTHHSEINNPLGNVEDTVAEVFGDGRVEELLRSRGERVAGRLRRLLDELAQGSSELSFDRCTSTLRVHISQVTVEYDANRVLSRTAELRQYPPLDIPLPVGCRSRR